MKHESIGDPDLHTLRSRLSADVAAGRTVVLSKTELASPRVRERLPQLLDELTPPDPQRGQLHVPGYTLLGEIGRGGMSTVHLARHDALGRHVALKVAPKWRGDGRTQQRLLDEARAMARVSHPHVVAIHDVIELDDTVAIAMEWIDGMTLAGLLHALPLPPAAVDMAAVTERLGTPTAAAANLERTTTRFFVQLLHDIARAAHAVHQAGLLHLDIKPSNILIRRDGSALLADFGVVREMDLVATHTLTFAGTPIYASLEQLRRDDKAFSAATDVYALGVTLYEALARQQPLANLDLKALVETVAHGRMPPLSRQIDVAPDLATIVHKAIAPEHTHRYASAAAFADDLQAFLEGRPIQGRPLHLRARLQRWARNEPWKAALAGVLAVLLPLSIGLGGYLLAMLPRIEESRREERVAQAHLLKQSAFQTAFLRDATDNECHRLLNRALALDPSPTSLACLLFALDDEQDPALATELRNHAAMIDAHPGLRAFRRRVAEKRSFFDAAELAELRTRADATDSYVLALDRVMYADDRAGPSAYGAAMDALFTATLYSPEDPLLQGMLAWCMARSDQRDRVEDLTRALTRRWPDNLEAATWTALAVDAFDRTQALAVMRRAAARHPDHPRTPDLLIGFVYRAALALRDDPAAPAGAAEQLLREVMELTGRIAPAARSSHAATWRCQARRLLGEADANPEPGESVSSFDATKLATANDRTGLDAFADRLLAQERPPAHQLARTYDAYMRLDDPKRLEALWQKWRATYPDRIGLHFQRARTLYRQGLRDNVPDRNLGAIGKLAPDLELTPRNLRDGGVILATSLVHGHDWQALRKHAEHWLRHGADDSRAQAASYLGLAASRLGDVEAARLHLGSATLRPPTGERFGWYRWASMELAWLLLDDSHGIPADAPAAKACVVRCDEFFRQHGEARREGMWHLLVRAKVLAMNGDLEGALRLAREAQGRPVEPHAPDDIQELANALTLRWAAK